MDRRSESEVERPRRESECAECGRLMRIECDGAKYWQVCSCGRRVYAFPVGGETEKKYHELERRAQDMGAS